MGNVERPEVAFFLIYGSVLAVLLLSCLGYPSQSGVKPEKHRLQAWDALQYAKAKGNEFAVWGAKAICTPSKMLLGLFCLTRILVLERVTTKSHSSLRHR